MRCPFLWRLPFGNQKFAPKGTIYIYIYIYQLGTDATIFTPFIIYLDTHHAGYNGPFLFLMPFELWNAYISHFFKATEGKWGFTINVNFGYYYYYYYYHHHHKYLGQVWHWLYDFRKSLKCSMKCFIFTSIYFSRKTKESDGKFRNISLFCRNGILKIN